MDEVDLEVPIQFNEVRISRHPSLPSKSLYTHIFHKLTNRFVP